MKLGLHKVQKNGSSKAVRAVLNLKYIGEELGISVPEADTPVIKCDAAAVSGTNLLCA